MTKKQKLCRATDNCSPTTRNCGPAAAGLCLLAALGLMFHPMGVTMRFMLGPDDIHVVHYPYFSRMPLGYGDWFPALSAFFSAAALAVLAVRRKKPAGAAAWCTGLAAAMTPLTWLLFDSFAPAGAAILVLQLISLGIQLAARLHRTE